jgi:hypothetical protein
VIVFDRTRALWVQSRDSNERIMSCSLTVALLVRQCALEGTTPRQALASLIRPGWTSRSRLHLSLVQVSLI